MRIGYARVSTRDQNPGAQQDALTAAGCEQIFTDKVSGKLARRPELDKALLVACRRGDQLVVTKLDRLGRSLEHLIDLSAGLQQRGVDLVVLDQGIDTSTAVGRMFFQILGAIAEFEAYAELGIALVMPTARLCRLGGKMSARTALAGRLSRHNHRLSRKASRVSDGL